MAQQTINIGASPNDGTGTPLRTAFQYTNSNFSELYTAVGPSGNNIVVPGSATITGDLTVDTSTLKVDSANNQVGIGTATPGGALEVFKNTNGQNRLFLNNPSTGASAYDAIDFTAGTANNQILSMGSGYSGSFPYLTGALLLRSAQANGIVLNTAGSAAAIQFGINDTLAMTLNATGLGLGVSPVTALSFPIGTNKVVGQSATSSHAAGNVGSLKFGIADGGGDYSGIQIFNTHNGTYSSQDIRFFTGEGGVSVCTERMRITPSGNVGIGVQPSAWVAGAKALQFGAYGALAQSSSGNIELSFNSYNSGAGAYKYLQTDTASLYRASSVHSWFIAPSGTAGNVITYTQAMTLDASGRLLVGPTSANASGGVLQLSSGITFPATQVASSDANTLDDYEEGTWTIGLEFGGASTGITTNSNQGKYTKIGNQVTINGYLALSNKGSSTGNAVITGLPFLANGYTAVSLYMAQITFADVPMGFSNNGTSTIILRESTNAGVSSTLTDADFANNSEIMFNMTYFV